MSLPGAAAKNAPVLLPIIGGGIALHDPMLVKAGAVLLGLAFGAMWRAGSLASEGKAWPKIRSDLGISALIGGANAVLTLSLVDLLKIGPLLAMGLGVIIGATGLRALPEIRDAVAAGLRRRLIGDDVIAINPRNDSLNELARQLDQPPEGKDAP